MNIKALYIIIGILLTLLLLTAIKLVEAKNPSPLEEIKSQIDTINNEVLILRKEEKDLTEKLNITKQKRERAVWKSNCFSLNGELILKDKQQLDCGNGVEKYATPNLYSIRQELGL